MKTSLIWDLDGTLADSYKVIVSTLHGILLEAGIAMEQDEIKRYVIRSSVTEFIAVTADKLGLDPSAVKRKYSEINDRRNAEIEPMRNAAKLLQTLSDMGVVNLIYTHRGKSTDEVLLTLGIKHFFTEVVTSQSGFARKPSPEAIDYLIEKHALCRERTFYVGDRSIDVECAKNAGIKSILYLPPDSFTRTSGCEDFVVSDLMAIAGLVL